MHLLDVSGIVFVSSRNKRSLIEKDIVKSDKIEFFQMQYIVIIFINKQTGNEKNLVVLLNLICLL